MLKMTRFLLAGLLAWMVAGGLCRAQSSVSYSAYILGLPTASSLAGTERMYVLQGTSKATTPQQILGILSGDCTFASSILCTKTNGVAFAPSATTDTTNASNIGSGTLNTLRLPSPFASGTATGNSGKFLQYSGSAPVAGHIAVYDSNGNAVDSGSAPVAVTEQKNTAGAGLSTSGNCDNTSTNASSPCQYAVTGAPYFRAHASGSQSLSGTAAIINLDTVDFQVGGAFNTTTHRFNPQVAGTYLICFAGRIAGSFVAANGGEFSYGKNGTTAVADFLLITSGTVSALNTSGCSLVQMNGSTDTLELDADATAGATPTTDNTATRTYMTGQLVGP